MDFRLAHDVGTSRPLRYGDWLCDCEGCTYALRHHVDTYGDLALVFKRAAGRDVVQASEYLARPYELIQELLEHPRDYVREVFVARHQQ